jgi:hypothetical protein
MNSVFINCRQAHALLSGQCDGALRWRQHLQLRIHLLGCDACSVVKRNFAFLSLAVRRLDRPADR